jgi:hypothetical protein
LFSSNDTYIVVFDDVIDNDANEDVRADPASVETNAERIMSSTPKLMEILSLKELF